MDHKPQRKNILKKVRVRLQKLATSITAVLFAIAVHLKPLFHHTKKATKTTYHKSKKAAKAAHHHAAVKPHQKLIAKEGRYAKWHAWNRHKLVHYAALGIYFVVIAVVVFSNLRQVFAADLTDTWDFSNSEEYNLSTGVENSDTGVRLKAQNYASDANTQALYHFDETSYGGAVSSADSSANANTVDLHDGPTLSNAVLNNGLHLNGQSQHGSVEDSSSLSMTSNQTLEGWIKPNSTFNSDSTENQTILDKGSYKLGLNNTNGRLAYEIQNSSGNQWTKRIADDTNNGGWQFNRSSVESSVGYGSDVYVGLGVSRGDAEVWKWNGSKWSQVGGDGMSNSWADQTYEAVSSLAVNGTALYAGLGTSGGDGEVWTCNLSTNCTSWTKIGGDNLSFSGASTLSITSLRVHGGSLYAGTSGSAGAGDVWRYNGGTSWTQIGGDGLNTSWAASTYELVQAMYSDGVNLYAGLGSTVNDAEVWRYNGTSWSQIGGDGMSSSWNTNYEQVRALTGFNGKIYAGLGDSGGDAQVYEYNGSTWSNLAIPGAVAHTHIASLVNDGSNLYAARIGNNTATTNTSAVYKWDGTTWTAFAGNNSVINGSWTIAQSIPTLLWSNNKLYASPSTTTGTQLSMFWEYSGSAWTQIGGGYLNESWGGGNTSKVTSTTTVNGKMYISLGEQINTAAVYEYDGTTANRIGGGGLNNSWGINSYESVLSMVGYKGNLYVGLGTTAGDAEIWSWNGSTWSQVGGDGVGSSWQSSDNFTLAKSLAVWKGKLYAGTGNGAGMAEIWEYNGSTWSKIAGDGVNSSWTTNPRLVETMTVYKDKLCAGLGGNGSWGEIWCWGGGNTWSRIGGGNGISVNGFSNSTAWVYQLITFNGKMYAGASTGSHIVTIWEWDGSSWTQVGGSDVKNSWSDSSYTTPSSIAVYNGELYLGMNYSGSSNPTGDVWKYNGTAWSQVGGDGLNGSWSVGDLREEVSSLLPYKGKLYAGLGFSVNTDALLYSYGNNGFIESNTNSFSTDWHHVAATFDGTSMKIYIDGTLDASATVSLTGVDNSLQLKVGTGWGSAQSRDSQGYFNGILDEIRISNVARNSFTSKPYSSNSETVTLGESVRKSGVTHWDGFESLENPNGGAVKYRLSDDGGDTWKYWTGSVWDQSTVLTDANSVEDIHDHIEAFPVTFEGIKWQAVLKGDGYQQVELQSVELTSTSDSDAPAINASNITAKRTKGGASITSNSWTNGSSPYFSWDAAEDEDSDILGYCLYLGQTPSSDPVTTKGLLGTSPQDTGGHCQFATSDTELDLATPSRLGTALTSSNTPYYLNIKAIDTAGNIADTSAQFHFRFDNTAASNPSFISAPSSFVNTKTATLTWPTAGGQAASDANSGLAGLQYRIGNSGTWYGDDHTGTGDVTDLLANDGEYTTVDPPDFDNITDGVNTIYFRTWDNAGNVTTSYTAAALKVNTTGAPSEPQNVNVTPNSNTSNSFAFSWDEPATFNTTTGNADKLSYCYTVNTLPTVNNCNFTGQNVTSLSAGAYATQPGTNTFYVVAKDDFNAINYSSYASAAFTANTPAPGMPLDIDIADVSVKATESWRLAVTWSEPSSVGAGIASYRIYRSTNNASFSQVGTSSSTSYVDSGLSQQNYYYRVTACDSANNCGANSGTVTMLPTGKFTTPASATSEPKVSDITTKRATISWSTDRNSDSKISIGTTSGSYSPSEIGNSSQVTAHEIDMDNLAAGTTYYYKAKWTDEDGNTGSSQEYTFTTAPAPVLKEVSTVSVSLNSATVRFTTKDAVKVQLNFGQSDAFGGVKTINTSSQESTYEVELSGLSDGTKYLYKLTMFDSEGGQYTSSIFSLSTPPRPKISNLRFQPMQGEPTSTQQVSWDTNVPTDSSVSYNKADKAAVKVEDPQMKTTHEVIIKGLEDDSEYTLIAQGRDSNGNLATSDKQVFKTALDTRSPAISEIVIEPSIRGTGSEARGQIVVSWHTDEPSTSQVAYAEGSNTKVFNTRTAEDAQLTTEHLVIVSDLPTSRVYSISPQSRDKANNLTSAEPQAAIIGRASESVLNIVLSTLQKVFGF